MKSKPETTALVSVNEYSFLKQEVKGTVEASQFKWRLHGLLEKDLYM